MTRASSRSLNHTHLQHRQQPGVAPRDARHHTAEVPKSKQACCKQTGCAQAGTQGLHPGCQGDVGMVVRQDEEQQAQHGHHVKVPVETPHAAGREGGRAEDGGSERH